MRSGHHNLLATLFFSFFFSDGFLGSLTVNPCCLTLDTRKFEGLRIYKSNAIIQCALDESGALKEAQDIEFFHSESETTPLPNTKSTNLRRGERKKNTEKMHTSIAAEQCNELGVVLKKHRLPEQGQQSGRPAKKPKINTTDMDNKSDPDDGDFASDGSLMGSSEDNDTEVDEVHPSNAEIADILPSKTIPTTGRGAGKRKKNKVTVEEVEDVESAQNLRARSPVATGSSIIEVNDSHQKSQRLPTRNPIYYFYEKVEHDAKGSVGNVGDKHYKCFHGNQKVLTITKAMKSSLNGLIGNLKSSSPTMFRLYMILKSRHPEGNVTQAEIDIASGKRPLTAEASSEFVGGLEAQSESIRDAFTKQKEQAAGPWSHTKFQDLLTKWIVASDQPFDTVENPEFQELITYIHHPAPTIKIPGRHVIRRQAMKMGEDAIEATKKMFAELDGKISISLDAWTSSNMYAFTAIIAHYANKAGQLEELLIDFRELHGEHSGENIAEAVWETLVTYGIEGRILAFMLDNASNNDTFVDGIERRCKKAGVSFKASWARLRCMPHTIHLAAIKLLEGIGAVSSAEGKKAASRSGNYQNAATASLNRDLDDDATTQDDGEPDPSRNILSSVDKLRKIVRAVRSSPQRKQRWLNLVTLSFQEQKITDRRALMLILDVRTRWSSTHQMMRRALDFRTEIDDFIFQNEDLANLALSEAEWGSITQVAGWLKAFRSATTQMSTTKESMLSTSHAIFRGLQDEVRDALRSLPDSASPMIKTGLLAAHQKLSEYYYRFDLSPFYIWAALLDPRISYEGLKADYDEDVDLLIDLEKAKSALHSFYQDHYSNFTSSTHKHLSTTIPVVQNGSPQKVDFTARYKRTVHRVFDELEDYFKLRQEDFDTCQPLSWWWGRRAQFPNLYRLARDILVIPGSAVAVERIFSGGRDTISLRRASLHPDTIRSLMLVKHRVRLSRAEA